MPELYERLKEIRLESGLKQAEVEALSGFLQKDISKYESGNSKFIPQEYILFWYKKGYNVNWLYSGRGPKRLDEKAGAEVPVLRDSGLSYGHPAVVTVAPTGEDNIVLVPVKAQAGYIRGLRDREYFERLPTFRMPRYGNGIYRGFEVDGYSMLTEQGIGLHPTDYVVGRFVEKLDDIKDNKVYIIVNDANGLDDIIIKRCFNTVKNYEWLLCKSDNKSGEYPDIHLDPKFIKEVWEWKGLITAYYPNVTDIYEELNQVKIELSYLRQQITQKQIEP
jgi:transcriptional regulator with XRE-family HTH domain